MVNRITDNDMSVSKTKYRRIGKTNRAGLTGEKRKCAERQIRETLRMTQAYRQAEKILIYASYGGEVSTWEMMQAALEDGKQVFCPKTVVSDTEKRLDFYRIFETQDLIPGFRGIMEPKVLEQNKYGKNWDEDRGKTDMIILPGCAFDRKCHRLGYGGGFYDRFLAEHPELMKIAVCFSCQVLETVPQEETDICPDHVITEEEILYGSDGNGKSGGCRQI